jgi:RHS repeat-associated protein
MADDEFPWFSPGQVATGSSNVAAAPLNKQLKDAPAQNSCFTSKPINLATGEEQYTCVDLVIPGRGMDVEIKHTYRSGIDYNGLYGYGWSINYHQRLKRLSNGNVVILNGLGRSDEYTYVDGINFNPPSGVFETLVKNMPSGTWTLTKAQGEKWNFDINGNLSSIVDRNNNTISFAYEAISGIPVLFSIIGKSVFNQDPLQRVVVGQDFRIATITDTVGRQINFTYNTDGRLDKITDFAGREVKFTYDPNEDNLLTIKKPTTPQFPLGVTKTFTYTNHNLEIFEDAKGQAYATNHYDAQERVFKQDLGVGSILFNYNIAGKTTVTDRKGFVTTYTFDASGHMTKKEEFTAGLHPGDPASFSTNYTYDSNGSMISVTYPKGNGIKYVYDSGNSNPRARGNLLQIRRKTSMAAADNDTLDIVTNFTYESQFNQVKTVTDPKANITTYTYDYELLTNHPKYNTKGNLIFIDYPTVVTGIPTIEFAYNANGQITQMIDPNGIVTDYTYFPVTGYLQSIARDPAGINAVTQFTYDNFGYPDTITDANSHVTDLNFNELGWLIQETNPRTYLTKYSYDQNGNVTKIERQADAGATVFQATEMTYDILNHLKTVKDPLNRVTTYNYDNNENLSSVIDAIPNTITYQYDERNKLFKIFDANSPQGVTQYDYDTNGNLKKIKDAKNQETNYAFDLFDRLDIMTYADLSFVNYDYDKNSNLDFVTLPVTHGTIDYVYDELNRLTNTNYPNTPADNKTFVYDLSSRLTDANTNDPSNLNPVLIQFTYDNLNRVDTNTTTLNSIPYLLDYDYDKVSNRTKVTYPSGKVVDYTYDANDNMDLVKVNTATLTDYNYDTLDRITQKSFISATLPLATYQFDIANQLSSITNKLVNATAISQYIYSQYDNVGNRKQFVTTGAPGSQTINYEYNTIYELTGVTGSQTHSYDYDNVANRQIADGVTYTPNNLNQYTSVGATTYLYDNNGNLTFDGNAAYTYDEENRLTTYNLPLSTGGYAYDAFNRRVSKTVNGITTYFINDGDREVEERDSSGALLADYVFGDSIDEVLTMTRGSNTYYYHYDGLGSVTEITDASGSVVENYTYDPYGTPSIINSAIGNPFRFTGRRFDEETGLYFNRNRMLDSKIGRFTQRDPMGYYDSMNLYQAVGNNPVNYVDPNGEFLVPILVGAASGAGFELASQIIGNAITGCHGINWKSVGKAALVGGTFGGAFQALSKLATIAKWEQTASKSSFFKVLSNEKGFANFGSNKIFNKQVSDVAKQLGMKGVEKKEFGNYIEFVKDSIGKKGADNFTYKELLELGKEFMQQ